MKLLRLAQFFAAVLITLSGTPRLSANPAEAAAARLSGTYVFEGLGKYQPGEFPNPLLDFAEIASGSEVRITLQADRLEVKYRSQAGKSVTRAISIGALPTGSQWKNGALVTYRKVPVTGGFILPGAARHYRGSRISKDAEGQLSVTGSFTEKGLMLFVIPFTDHAEYKLILKKLP